MLKSGEGSCIDSSNNSCRASILPLICPKGYRIFFGQYRWLRRSNSKPTRQKMAKRIATVIGNRIGRAFGRSPFDHGSIIHLPVPARVPAAGNADDPTGSTKPLALKARPFIWVNCLRRLRIPSPWDAGLPGSSWGFTRGGIATK